MEVSATEDSQRDLISHFRDNFEVILYIATSEDGFIAEADGSVDWLNNFSKDNFDTGSETKTGNEPDDCGYSEFYASVDINVMGRKTYEQVIRRVRVLFCLSTFHGFRALMVAQGAERWGPVPMIRV